MKEQHERASPRLQFTKEELENPELAKPIHKAEKAADKYEKAQNKLKKKRTLKLTREEVEAESPVDGHQPAEAIPTEEIPVADPSAPAVLNTRKKPNVKAETAPVKPTSVPSGKKAEAIHEVKKKTVRLKFEETKAKPPSKIQHPVTRTVNTELHRTTAASNEDDNVAVSASLEGEKAGEKSGLCESFSVNSDLL